MSRKPSFANLRDRAAMTPSTTTGEKIDSPLPSAERAHSKRPASRQGRKQIAGFFSPKMSLAMHMLALRQDRSLQAVMNEAFNDILRKYGESPIGD